MTRAPRSGADRDRRRARDAARAGIRWPGRWFLPDALCRLNDVAPRPRAQAAPVLRYDAGDLARILASRDAALAAELAGEDAATAAQLVSTLREHWRVEVRWAPAVSSPGRRAVEVLDSDHGLWLVVPDGEEVELQPTTPTAVFRRFIGLLPDHSELALDPALDVI